MTCVRLTSLLLLFLPSAGAQTYSLSGAHNAVVSIDSKVRFHQGVPSGNPLQFASPNYDDSAWPLADVLIRPNEHPERKDSEYWYRFKLTAPASTRTPLSLRIDFVPNFAVYVDGRLVGGCGLALPGEQLKLTICPPRVLPLPNLVPGHAFTVAIDGRSTKPGLGAYFYSKPTFGDTQTLNEAQTAYLNDLHWKETQVTIALVFELLAILLAISLFLFRLKGYEYLWFLMVMLADVVSDFAVLYPISHDLPLWMYAALNDIEALLYTAPLLLLAAALLKARRTRVFYLVTAAAMLADVLNQDSRIYDPMHARFALPLDVVGTALSLLPAAWLIGLFFKRLKSGNTDAKLLFLPFLMTAIQVPYVWLLQLCNDVSGKHYRFLYTVPFTQTPFPISLYYCEDLVLIVALLLVLVLRFSRSHASEERLQGDLEDARQVQQLLLPPIPARLPGFELESIYLPAQEIGGDFFHFSRSDDGALQLVVGDVSGKGLSAALTVSVLIGALRSAPKEGPAATLNRLNHAVCGHIPGFSTCCAMQIFPNGRVLVSNAGHLSPYIAGKEYKLPDGLPLGLLEDPGYDEQAFILPHGQTLTFVSDGVVEAGGKKGELFGFERTETLSAQPAKKIAEVARVFGQTDDITVVSVTLVRESGT